MTRVVQEVRLDDQMVSFGLITCDSKEYLDTQISLKLNERWVFKLFSIPLKIPTSHCSNLLLSHVKTPPFGMSQRNCIPNEPADY